MLENNKKYKKKKECVEPNVPIKLKIRERFARTMKNLHCRLNEGQETGMLFWLKLRVCRLLSTRQLNISFDQFGLHDLELLAYKERLSVRLSVRKFYGRTKGTGLDPNWNFQIGSSLSEIHSSVFRPRIAVTL